MASVIKSNLSSFVDYKEPIFIQWLSYYEATDRTLKEKEIEFLRPHHQILRRAVEANQKAKRSKGTNDHQNDYKIFLSHLRRFVKHEYLSDASFEGSDEELWTRSGQKMATELIHVRTAVELHDWPKKFADKDRWRAWLFDRAKDSIDDVLEPIFDSLYYEKHDNEVIKIQLNTEFKRSLEVKIDMPTRRAIHTIYPFLEKYPSDDKILDAFNSLVKSEDKIPRLLAEYINDQLTISNMGSIKAFKRSLAKGRKILYS